MAARAREVLRDKKGDNIVLLDVRELSGITDYYLIVSGASTPHLKAMFEEVQHVLKKEDVFSYRKAGTPECGWMVIDYINVIIHIFLDPTRQYYAIEELWASASRVD